VEAREIDRAMSLPLHPNGYLRNGDKVLVLDQDRQPVRCIANNHYGGHFQAYHAYTPFNEGTWGALLAESEGVWWARGWDPETAKALRAASLLAQSA
jgi:hypothetical protein